ncbi:hypothetical protein ACFLQ0_03870 [Nitrospinota bacterium]
MDKDPAELDEKSASKGRMTTNLIHTLTSLQTETFLLAPIQPLHHYQ